jgi:hypothetical protein
MLRPERLDARQIPYRKIGDFATRLRFNPQRFPTAGIASIRRRDAATGGTVAAVKVPGCAKSWGLLAAVLGLTTIIGQYVGNHPIQ